MGIDERFADVVKSFRIYPSSVEEALLSLAKIHRMSVVSKRTIPVLEEAHPTSAAVIIIGQTLGRPWPDVVSSWAKVGLAMFAITVWPNRGQQTTRRNDLIN